MHLDEYCFRRRFSVNLYRSLRLPMGEMSFYKNWAEDKRGDPYPVLLREGALCEKVGGGTYRLFSEEGGRVRRLLGRFFPWATYELKLCEASAAEVGFSLSGAAGDLSVTLREDRITLDCDELKKEFSIERKPNAVLSVTFRTGGVSLYLNGALVGDTSLEMMHRYRNETVFSQATVSIESTLEKGGGLTLSDVTWYLCGGLSHADIKPVRYEDGTPIMESGRVFLTVTSRTEAEMYQSVLSWNPTLCDFRLEGAIFFDCGDGDWCSDVASSLVFDRKSQRWLLWMAAFSHGHVLGRAALTDDPRFGIHVVNVRLMERAREEEPRTVFRGFWGDEDPDLLCLDGKWHLAICRKEKDGFHYYRFVSDDPLDGFSYVDRTPHNDKTGGMFVKTEEGYYFVCGSDFHARSVYEVSPLEDFSICKRLHCDYDDGGFRGWGTVMMLPMCGRKRYVWITFDRHNVSSYGWSYGNLYVFDSDPISQSL